MHAEHEILHRKYINDETMSFDAISEIPRANFWTSEDGYAWDMEELAAAITSGKGVERNLPTNFSDTNGNKGIYRRVLDEQCWTALGVIEK